MKTYPASKAAAEGWAPGTREWVFELLGSSRYRERAELLSGLELRRRPDCEPCLRALVLDEWTPETHHHLGWCDSCRKAGFALGMGAPAAAASAARVGRRHTAWVVLAAGLAIAGPLVASTVIDNPFGSQEAPRGGVAATTPQAPATTPGGPAVTTPGEPTVTPVPRGRPASPAVRHGRSARGQRALPKTT
jgi:hypothetical protein